MIGGLTIHPLTAKYPYNVYLEIIIIIIISSGFMPSMRETGPKRHYKVNH